MLRAVVIAIVAIVARDAFAEDEWAKGVPENQQQQANALFAEGNDFFARQAHASALEKYRAAIALWDHPLIRLNMAVTEIRLDRILDAARDLEKALSYGEAPFTPDLYRMALDYRNLVAGRVGEVEASCKQPNVRVLLDGKPWFTCPGTGHDRLLAGEHLIVAEGASYIPRSMPIVVVGGKAATHELSLISYESAVTLSYRYPRWLPPTIAGSGAAIALAGLGVWLIGRSGMDQYKSDFARQCPSGCRDDDLRLPLLDHERSRARLEGGVGIALMATGGAATAVGIVMVVLNSKAKRTLPRIEAEPAAGGATASAAWTF